MSQIKLKHSGGNSVIIAAPDSNPTQDRTLKLPSDGDGTILTTNSATGKILQVKQAYKTDTFSANLARGAESGDVTGFSVTITPSSASNKILIMFDFTACVDNSSSGSRLAGTIYKDGSILTNSLGETSGSKSRVTAMSACSNIDRHYIVSGKFLDTAGGTNAITYTMRLRHGRDTTVNIYFGRSGQWTDHNYHMSCGNNLTVMEVAE